ncbi:forkhead box protein N2 [Ornithorhynchus anatinus]|uniref:forkhead box protein N2 n=1 Tax=Ornithorhynchus anatinus TaxID=9258 RepID=UPI0019D4CA79|nr:forkhead box protein N2 [Ornithorhynchus anatinus]
MKCEEGRCKGRSPRPPASRRRRPPRRRRGSGSRGGATARRRPRGPGGGRPMGPVTGMTPDGSAETPGAEKAAGLSQADGAGGPPEALAAPRPRPGPPASACPDEELTNLNWLHESSNLLTDLSLGSAGLSLVGPLDGPPDGPEGPVPPRSPGPGTRSPTAKPPYSFSLLIYMAIENSASKCLPVKEIYSWIVERFPYFGTAPTGWKNSVRHNLSLNKCFRKVERSRGKVNGKGSLWCVDPEYKPNLIQALKKQPFPSAFAFYTPPASPESSSSPPHFLTSTLKRNQGRTLKESDFDAAAAMMLLNSSIEQGILDCEKPPPAKAAPPKKRSHGGGASGPPPAARPRDGDCPEGPGGGPQEDHNYSASAAVPGPAAPPGDGSDGFRGGDDEEDDEEEDGEDYRGGPPAAGRAPRPCPRRSGPGPGRSGKRARGEGGQEIDEELKEAAGSLLHLAGIRTCLLSTAKARSQKQRRK